MRYNVGLFVDYYLWLFGILRVIPLTLQTVVAQIVIEHARALYLKIGTVQGYSTRARRSVRVATSTREFAFLLLRRIGPRLEQLLETASVTTI